ncbi:23S rRNA (adenine(2503)-C(2))-methyltransferase RlmN [Cardinium endosymbiont of Culicoides punctatus]|uniref:23S rRNA (adenine(2503)-C(2))-methyltransferase RlmN n=1 Tax=Cardinium endosymbiont of Culicoides punctatus TaxID=2304601 RepID=UPI001058F38C|nr:23S rRNA (adenine(2503)-C(2))-methyltransferase RlmN [Cardinium endosymbiont of Culicoides punctatus]TDG95361.1 putative dual-specificity RNA methyltransferase RlmN [Cardinium endosymbiont of Culicoides punctatus]
MSDLSTPNCPKQSIYNITLKDLSDWLIEQGEKSFRATQIWNWLYVKRVDTFSEMSDLSISTRWLLDKHFSLTTMVEDTLQRSKDGTIKCLLKLSDGNLIETVLMKHAYGLSICVTTQVGCNIGCTFCASGLLTKSRDLTAGEIVEQVRYMQKKLDLEADKKRVSHIVVMGIGEPFDNYDNVLRFIRIVNHPQGLAIGARHITVSTSGLDRKIRAFAHEGLQVNLALSLHAANNELRTRIMKLNKAIPIEKLMEAVDYYLDQTNRRITFEYILLKDVNDLESSAFDLANLILARNRLHLIHVNLIPYNPVHEFDHYKRSESKAIHRFVSILRAQGINAVVRGEHGTDIDAACGQLRSKQLKARAAIRPIAIGINS